MDGKHSLARAAVRWLSVCLLLAWSGAGAADFQKGLDAYKAGNYREAALAWRPLADGGHMEAQFHLGQMSDKGLGSKANPAAAVHWYTRAAEQGHAGAQITLAAMYEAGRGVKKNLERAAFWARLFDEGRGVARDPAQAFEWYSQAAEAGDGSAQQRVAQMYEAGHGVGKNAANALRWYAKAWSNGAGEEALQAIERLVVPLARFEVTRQISIYDAQSGTSAGVIVAKGMLVAELSRVDDWSEVVFISREFISRDNAPSRWGKLLPLAEWWSTPSSGSSPKELLRVGRVRSENLIEPAAAEAARKSEAEAARKAEAEAAKRREQEEAAAAKRRQQEEEARHAQWIKQLNDFRASLSEGSETNCGPVLEIKKTLIKVYAPVENFSNEHWLRRDTVFPPGYGCLWINGRYQPPIP